MPLPLAQMTQLLIFFQISNQAVKKEALTVKNNNQINRSNQK